MGFDRASPTVKGPVTWKSWMIGMVKLWLRLAGAKDQRSRSGLVVDAGHRRAAAGGIVDHRGRTTAADGDGDGRRAAGLRHGVGRGAELRGELVAEVQGKLGRVARAQVRRRRADQTAEWREPETVALNVALPLASVFTVAEPSSVSPWP